MHTIVVILLLVPLSVCVCVCVSSSSCVRCAWVQCIDVFAEPMGGCSMGNLELTFQPPTLSSSAGGETQRELLVHKQNLAKGPVAPWEAPCIHLCVYFVCVFMIVIPFIKLYYNSTS